MGVCSSSETKEAQAAAASNAADQKPTKNEAPAEEKNTEEKEEAEQKVDEDNKPSKPFPKAMTEQETAVLESRVSSLKTLNTDNYMSKTMPIEVNALLKLVTAELMERDMGKGRQGEIDETAATTITVLGLSVGQVDVEILPADLFQDVYARVKDKLIAEQEGKKHEEQNYYFRKREGAPVTDTWWESREVIGDLLPQGTVLHAVRAWKGVKIKVDCRQFAYKIVQVEINARDTVDDVRTKLIMKTKWLPSSSDMLVLQIWNADHKEWIGGSVLDSGLFEPTKTASATLSTLTERGTMEVTVMSKAGKCQIYCDETDLVAMIKHKAFEFSFKTGLTKEEFNEMVIYCGQKRLHEWQLISACKPLGVQEEKKVQLRPKKEKEPKDPKKKKDVEAIKIPHPSPPVRGPRFEALEVAQRIVSEKIPMGFCMPLTLDQLTIGQLRNFEKALQDADRQFKANKFKMTTGAAFLNANRVFRSQLPVQEPSNDPENGSAAPQSKGPQTVGDFWSKLPGSRGGSKGLLEPSSSGPENESAPPVAAPQSKDPQNGSAAKESEPAEEEKEAGTSGLEKNGNETPAGEKGQIDDVNGHEDETRT